MNSTTMVVSLDRPLRERLAEFGPTSFGGSRSFDKNQQPPKSDMSKVDAFSSSSAFRRSGRDPEFRRIIVGPASLLDS